MSLYVKIIVSVWKGKNQKEMHQNTMVTNYEQVGL